MALLIAFGQVVRFIFAQNFSLHTETYTGHFVFCELLQKFSANNSTILLVPAGVAGPACSTGPTSRENSPGRRGRSEAGVMRDASSERVLATTVATTSRSTTALAAQTELGGRDRRGHVVGGCVVAAVDERGGDPWRASQHNLRPLEHVEVRPLRRRRVVRPAADQRVGVELQGASRNRGPNSKKLINFYKSSLRLYRKGFVNFY